MRCDDLKLDDKTLVVFSSDNGPEWTGPENMKQFATGWERITAWAKRAGAAGERRSLFEGGVQLPFIVRWPGHTPAGVKDDSR